MLPQSPFPCRPTPAGWPNSIGSKERCPPLAPVVAAPTSVNRYAASANFPRLAISNWGFPRGICSLASARCLLFGWGIGQAPSLRISSALRLSLSFFVTGLLRIVTILYFSLEHHYLCFSTTESHNAVAGLRITIAIWIILITKENHARLNAYQQNQIASPDPRC